MKVFGAIIGLVKGKPKFIETRWQLRLFLFISQVRFLLLKMFRFDNSLISVRSDAGLSYFGHRLTWGAFENYSQFDKLPISRSPWSIGWRFYATRLVSLSSRGGLYQDIEHPLTAHLKSHRADSRDEFIDLALAGHTGLRSAIDIGCNNGKYSRQLARNGYSVQAFETNALSCWLAETWCPADLDIQVRHESILESERIGDEVGIILALSIFHHFIRSEHLLNKFKAFLGRLDCELMVFEPHETGYHFEDSVIVFTEQEFCDFICKHSNLNRYKKIGRSNRGRPIYFLEK